MSTLVVGKQYISYLLLQIVVWCFVAGNASRVVMRGSAGNDAVRRTTLEAEFPGRHLLKGNGKWHLPPPPVRNSAASVISVSASSAHGPINFPPPVAAASSAHGPIDFPPPVAVVSTAHGPINFPPPVAVLPTADDPINFPPPAAVLSTADGHDNFPPPAAAPSPAQVMAAAPG